MLTQTQQRPLPVPLCHVSAPQPASGSDPVACPGAAITSTAATAGERSPPEGVTGTELVVSVMVPRSWSPGNVRRVKAENNLSNKEESIFKMQQHFAETKVLFACMCACVGMFSASEFYILIMYKECEKVIVSSPSPTKSLFVLCIVPTTLKLFTASDII